MLVEVARIVPPAINATALQAECESVVYIRAFFAVRYTFLSHDGCFDDHRLPDFYEGWLLPPPTQVTGMIGCLFIMGMIYIHRTYHNFGQRLIFAL